MSVVLTATLNGTSDADITAVTAGTGLTGGGSTGDVTVTLDTPVAIANGGTGAATAPNAINALLPTQTAHSGEYLTTNGTVASWASASGGASTALDNLASTAINASLVFGTGVTGSIATKATTGVSNDSAALNLKSGTVTSSISGVVTVSSGAVTSGFGSSGNVNIGSGNNAGSDVSGDVTVSTGTVGNATSGTTSIRSGAGTVAHSGPVILGSGTGEVNSGQTNLISGTANTGNSGNIVISPGTASVTRGHTVLNNWIQFDATNTAGGTTGAQTINKISGTVNFLATATTLVVTNNTVTTGSIVFAVIRTNDATATIKNVVPAAGSFTITLTAAATAETSVGFFVINQ